MRLVTRQDGQAVLLLVATMAAVLVGAVFLGGVAQGIGKGGREQRAADLGALAGARAMREAYTRLFEPPDYAGEANPRHLEVGPYKDLGRDAAVGVARANGARNVGVEFPDGDTFAPTQIRVTVRDPATSDAGGRHHEAAIKARAEAELAPPAQIGLPLTGGDGEYRGPFAYRQGKPMRPDTALAFDRMYAAARNDGIALIIVSAFRSNAEQAKLFAAHPDPKWVAPPGKSLHRLGTELDLGPASAYGWLAANAPRFGFTKRYSWEPWHFGLTRSPGSASVGFAKASDDGRSAIPSFVPPKYAPMLSRASQRWGVGAALLAAQLYAESNFNPNAVSSAGAQGIAQFTPGTARTYGLNDPFDPEASIEAQAHLMHDLLAQLGSVPLALAAYNAGPGRVRACMCVPPIPETQGYVARILGLLNGAGDQAGLLGTAGLEVRLVR
ncbi:MAG TPA: transglycosylase SLT domain-containing protein [Solirubrobacteraceae bacterium]|jgi:hypothetical protein|nr:transglycosylase SLT domain-containing protein [Solirubrobacteraceae bacterium]